MPPPSLSQPTGSSNTKWKIAGVLTLTAALLGAAAAFYIWTTWTKIPIDEATLCPQAGPSAIHAVLVDRSDPITPLQQARIRQVIDRIVSDSPIGGRVAFYLSESDGIETLKPLISLCNPGKDANPLYSNPKRIKQRYDRDFAEKMDSVRQKLLIGAARDNSPIMESIKAVCIDAFGTATPGIPLRLLIVSDMIQHTTIASHYRDRQFEAFLNSPRIGTVLANCRGADVDIIYLLRTDKRGNAVIQSRAHQRFWDLYLQKSNALPRSMEPL